MVGRLHCQGGSSLSRFLDQFQRLHRGQVNYVATHPETGREGSTEVLVLPEQTNTINQILVQYSKNLVQVIMLMFLLVLETEICDGADCLCLHCIGPGLQKGGVLNGV